MSILQTIDLKKYYGTEPNITRALDGVNFSVNDGEFVAVVGTSGSGKSTLLHMMGGLDTPTSGNVIVRDKELSKMNDEQLTIFRRRNIGFIFQNYNLVPILNVYEKAIYFSSLTALMRMRTQSTYQRPSWYSTGRSVSTASRMMVSCSSSDTPANGALSNMRIQSARPSSVCWGVGRSNSSAARTCKPWRSSMGAYSPTVGK